VIPGDYHLTLR